MTQDLVAMINRLRNGRYCWCIYAKGQHSPTCQDVQKLLAKVEYQKIDDKRHGR